MKSQDSEGNRDPVCGKSASTETPHKTTFKGHEIRFCSPHCLKKFQEDPGQFFQESLTEVSAYLICPMHPEVREPAPRCPKCGMMLEPAGTPAIALHH